MKYMTFTASCPYAAIANVLEQMNIDTEDYLIIKESQIPYLFSYYEKLGSYFCSSQLQGKFYFDLYLRQVGLTAKEVFLNKFEVCNYLKNNPLSILGLNVDDGRHAHVFIKHEKSTYIFLNPHYENDNRPDYLECVEEELLSLLDDKIGITTIVEASSATPDMIELITKSINDVKRYQEELYEFLSKKLTPKDILEKRDVLLRPIGLDLLPMMKIIGNEKLTELLTLIKKECLNLIMIKEPQIGFDCINKSTLDLFFCEYLELLSTRIDILCRQNTQI